MDASRTPIRGTETEPTRAPGADDRAWAAFEALSGGAPRAGMLRLGRAAGRPWSFSAFGTPRPPLGARGAVRARRAPAGAATVVLRVRALDRAQLDEAADAVSAAPVTLVGATN